MSAICESFRQEILEGIHQPGDIYKIALIKSGQARNFGKDLTNYSDLGSDEVEGGNGYTSGGRVRTPGAVQPPNPIDWTTGIVTIVNPLTGFEK
jgi:hypothetical protein